jgi:chorismate mutase
MAEINIPENAASLLRKITDLPDDVFSSLAAVLERSKPALTPKELLSQISAALKDHSPKEITEISGTLFILYRIRDIKNLTSEEVADQVAKVLAANGKVADPAQEAKIKSRLLAFLNNDAVAVTVKSLDVMTEHEHILCGARILSDIRPVFTSSLGTPSAAVIIHNLEIAYHDKAQNRHYEMYFAMDTNDIQKLKEVIERAEKKSAALKAMILNSKIPYLSP